jgi:hypothetical protein
MRIVVWGLMLFVVQPVAGQFRPQVFPTAPQGGALVDFLSVNRAGGSDATGFGVYVGPYDGMVGGAPASLYRVDFGHAIDGDDLWRVNATSLDGSESLADTRL